MHDLKDSQTGAFVGRNDRSMFTHRPKRAPKAASAQKTSAPNKSKRRFTPTRKYAK